MDRQRSSMETADAAAMVETDRFRAAVRGVLDAKGVTVNAKAQMRAAIYRTLLDPAWNPALESDRLNVAEAEQAKKVAAALVRDWLKANGLEHTLSVLMAEANMESLTNAHVSPPGTTLEGLTEGLDVVVQVGGDDSSA